MNINNIASQVKAASYAMGASSEGTRNLALKNVAASLSARKEEIFAANRLDLERSKKENLPLPLLNRLKFDEEKLQDCIAGINALVEMSDPLNQIDLDREIKPGLTLVRESCPIGVIGVIFESRPDALVQISALCIKSGNCLLLKGGKEAINTNSLLFEIVHQGCLNAKLPEYFGHLIKTREEIQQLLALNEYIDLIIPRGSNAFVKHIMENTHIPVMGHADGVCHIFVDKEADLKKALDVVINSKTQYVSACNSAETLLVHKDIAASFLPLLAKEVASLVNSDIQFITNDQSATFLNVPLTESLDYKTEYSDYILAVKIVDSLDSAVSHINHFGSHHTDSIVTEDKISAQKFMTLVDSAGVYHNASTRFADGFRYGFGAEVGISTGKLHARGPVGLFGLVTYKYKLFGDGHIV